MLKCAKCEFRCFDEEAMDLHTLSKHPMKIDPGAEFSAPKSNKTQDIIAWVRKNPNCTLKSGEGKLLLDEIDRLEGIRVTALTAAEKLEKLINQVT